MFIVNRKVVSSFGKKKKIKTADIFFPALASLTQFFLFYILRVWKNTIVTHKLLN